MSAELEDGHNQYLFCGEILLSLDGVRYGERKLDHESSVDIPYCGGTYCGDGILQKPNDDGFDEECDGDGIGEYQICSENCTLINLTYCGDSILQEPNDYNEFEECDGLEGVNENQTCCNYIS